MPSPQETGTLSRLACQKHACTGSGRVRFYAVRNLVSSDCGGQLCSLVRAGCDRGEVEPLDLVPVLRSRFDYK